MKWKKTNDPNVIECPPFFIRRCEGRNGTRYVLGRDIGKGNAECLGGFDSPDEAKKAAEVLWKS